MKTHYPETLPTPSTQTSFYPVIVVGSGIAGLSFALKVAQQGLPVLVITKKETTESNTNYAQGGIACVMDPLDNWQAHIRDTLTCGAGLCDPEAVASIIQDGPKGIQDLVDWGVAFCKASQQAYALGQEGGHSARRILHVKDMTGKAIEKALLLAVSTHPGITLWDHCLAIDLITSYKLGLTGQPDGPHCVHGLYVLNTQTSQVHTLGCRVVMLATGGIGQVYLYTTNPSIATGDGIAMAYRAGAVIQDMEFVQFHPTALYTPCGTRFLISEAARGEGARLLDANKQPLMPLHDPRGDLAPRDTVARVIDLYMKETGAPHVWLDMTLHTASYLQQRFPTIYSKCQTLGIDPSQDLIPVVPAAHYCCGGVQTNSVGQSTLGGLFAAGETGCTGFHGANRLASNSLLEAVVMASRAAHAAVGYVRQDHAPLPSLPAWTDGNVTHSDERVVVLHNSEELKRTLWDYVGIVRSDKRLQRALSRVQNLEKEINEYYWNFKVEPSLLELRNMVAVAKTIILSALARKESRGLHYTLDYPQASPHARHSYLTCRGGVFQPPGA
jgi:L-aspartate oxidase